MFTLNKNEQQLFAVILLNGCNIKAKTTNGDVTRLELSINEPDHDLTLEYGGGSFNAVTPLDDYTDPLFEVLRAAYFNDSNFDITDYIEQGELSEFIQLLANTNNFTHQIGNVEINESTPFIKSINLTVSSTTSVTTLTLDYNSLTADEIYITTEEKINLKKYRV